MSIATESAALDKEYQTQYWGKYFLIQKSEIPERPIKVVNKNAPLKFSPELLSRIIKCESGGNPKAKNPNSTARGLLQVIESSELFCEKGLGKELDMYNPDDNLLCGEYLLANGGLNHWNASRSCWE